MTDRNTEYLFVRNRKAKNSKQYYYDDDDNDDDNDNYSQIYGRLVPIKTHKERHAKYITSEEFDSDYRKHTSDVRLPIRKKDYADRIIVDKDDDNENIIKVVRHNRSPSASPVQHRRLKLRPQESQPIYYETSSGHLVSRPLKTNILQTKKTQVVYADDEPTKVIKKVIIDPRTGNRETIYEKDHPKKQRQFYLQQRPAEILFDSDNEDDYREQPIQYVKLIKRRTISTDELPKRDLSPKYIMIKKKPNSEPIYSLASKMPRVKGNRRVIYEIPAKKSLKTYIVSSDEKYYK